MKNDYKILGDTALIIITPKRKDPFVVLVDAEDMPKIATINYWHICGNKPSYYYIGGLDNSGKLILMHRLIMNAPRDMVVDHINKNTLDNRSCNLRVIKQTENMQNRKVHKHNKSGLRNVYWEKKNRKWRVCLRKDGKKIHVGYYANLEDANKAAIEARKIYLPFSTN